MRRVFHISLESVQYSSAAITHALGENCYQFNWQMARLEYGTDMMRRLALSTAEKFKPDVIFLHCQLPDAFDTETIKSLQAIAPVINFTFDVRQDIMWHKSIAPHIALTVFACEEDVRDCVSCQIPNVVYLPSSADFNFYKPSLHLGSKEKYYDIVFIGNDTVGSDLNYPLAQERRDMVAFMHDKFPDTFMSYGRAMKGGFVNTEQEVDIYNNCKIAITHNNFMRSGYCSDRDFRAVGCGPLVVHHFFPGVHDMFGRSAIVWTDHDDLAYSCDYFLRETYERITLAEQEHNRVITNHSWAKRMKQMFKLLDQVSAPA